MTLRTKRGENFWQSKTHPSEIQRKFKSHHEKLFVRILENNGDAKWIWSAHASIDTFPNCKCAKSDSHPPCPSWGLGAVLFFEKHVFVVRSHSQMVKDSCEVASIASYRALSCHLSDCFQNRGYQAVGWSCSSQKCKAVLGYLLRCYYGTTAFTDLLQLWPLQPQRSMKPVVK